MLWSEKNINYNPTTRHRTQITHPDHHFRIGLPLCSSLCQNKNNVSFNCKHNVLFEFPSSRLVNSTVLTPRITCCSHGYLSFPVETGARGPFRMTKAKSWSRRASPQGRPLLVTAALTLCIPAGARVDTICLIAGFVGRGLAGMGSIFGKVLIWVWM